MPGDQMVFVQVPQNTPESKLLMAQAAGESTNVPCVTGIL